MKVKCISNKTDNFEYDITKGKIYCAMGMTVNLSNGEVEFWIINNHGNYFFSMPFTLFEITDSSVSKYWSVKFDRGYFSMSHKDFLEPYFFDDLTDFEEKSVATFKRISHMIESEKNADTSSHS